MPRILPVTLLIALTGCHTASAPNGPPEQNVQQLQSLYDAAAKHYQAACFHDESDADVSAALHGSHAKLTTVVAQPSQGCTVAKAEMDKYEVQLRAAMSAQQAH